jgi:hypothetical protein
MDTHGSVQLHRQDGVAVVVVTYFGVLLVMADNQLPRTNNNA